MTFDIIYNLIIGMVASLIVALVFYLWGHFRRSGIKEKAKKTYSERLSELLSNLARASSEVDNVIGEITEIAHEKSETLRKFENDLANMEIREKELKDTIEALKNVPVPVAEHFAKLVRSGEKRSARRDYILFGSGVIVTTIIAIIIQLVTNKSMGSG